ncbi:MAG: D-aminoacylase [Acidobacteria bacterium]|nr:D-aminoacylase [Acidobacteriota bacterium]
MIGLWILLISLVPAPQAPDFDLLIRNARVIDGTGNPWYLGSVGIKDGRIAAVGSLSGSSATREIEAGGRVLSPGFIDVHTHIETTRTGGIEKVPRGDNYLRDGVTTVVTGNCGTSEIDLGTWFGKLEQLGLGVNVASLIGHNSVRRAVMGDENRSASAAEFAQMQGLIEKAMQEGAVGFSTGLLYVPGTYAGTEEVVALARAAAKHGGIYASHIRDQGEQLMESIIEAVTVGQRAGMPVQISHFKVNSKKRWGDSVRSIDLVEGFRQDGVDVAVDWYPYDRASTSLSITLPTWALAGGQEKMRARLRDPSERARIASGMKDLLSYNGFSDYSYATVASYPPDPGIEGKAIAEITILRGRTATVENEIATILDLIEQHDASMIYHTMSMEDVERICRYPNTAVASDGGVQEFGVGVPHPRSYGTNARVIAEFVRSRKVLTLEDAVRRMTSLPALRFGFADRGMIREGMAADVVLFDPEKVEDKATFEQPHQFSEGFDLVVVNGAVAVDGGRLTDARAGRILVHRHK